MQNHSNPITIDKDLKPSYKDICNAFGCNSKPTEKRKIDCGKYGSLTIYVCGSCSSKFK